MIIISFICIMYNVIVYAFRWVFHFYFSVSVSTCSEPQTPAQTIDYNFAREELMLNELSNDPLQAAIAKIERQHEEDKQGTHSFYKLLYFLNFLMTYICWGMFHPS